MSNTNILFERRQKRTRGRLRKLAKNRPRLSVFRSSRHIHAQIIDDSRGRTLAAASSLEKALKIKKGSDVSAARAVGQLIAQRALKAGVENVVFDRGAYLYHGRVKALAESAREGGLGF